MSTDDISLRVGLLEIESSNVNKIIKDDNPFVTRFQRRHFTPPSKCICHLHKTKSTIDKRKHSKILREPVLKLLQHGVRSGQHKSVLHDASECPLSSANNISLHALVDTCNQLYISTDKSRNSKRCPAVQKCWPNSTNDKPLKETVIESASSSCSQQALNPSCDVTIDELASYFETLVHIPKKMSSMAEMMYI